MFIEVFERVLSKLLEKDGRKSSLNEAIRRGITYIRRKYSGEYLKLEANSINFNDPIYRCAYIYLYCTSHSIIVTKAFSEILHVTPEAFDIWLNEKFVKDRINICSLGGGPGSELVGILAFFFLEWDFAPPVTYKCSLVDAYQGWEDTCWTSLRSFCEAYNVAPERIITEFKRQNLLDSRMKTSTKTVVSEAHIITLVKFISAIECDVEGSTFLIRRIFHLLQTNAWVVFVDNAHNPSYRRMCQFAKSSGLEPVFGPFCPVHFSINCNQEKMVHFANYQKLFGCKPQTKATIAIGIWRKPEKRLCLGLKRDAEWIHATEACTSSKRAAIENGEDHTNNQDHHMLPTEDFTKDNPSSLDILGPEPSFEYSSSCEIWFDAREDPAVTCRDIPLPSETRQNEFQGYVGAKFVGFQAQEAQPAPGQNGYFEVPEEFKVLEQVQACPESGVSFKIETHPELSQFVNRWHGKLEETRESNTMLPLEESQNEVQVSSSNTTFFGIQAQGEQESLRQNDDFEVSDKSKVVTQAQMCPKDGVSFNVMTQSKLSKSAKRRRKRHAKAKKSNMMQPQINSPIMPQSVVYQSNTQMTQLSPSCYFQETFTEMNSNHFSANFISSYSNNPWFHWYSGYYMYRQSSVFYFNA